MAMRLRAILLAAAVIAGACGGSTKKSSGTTVQAPPKPEDAVAAAKLEWVRFREYYYCDLTYPKVCNDLPVAYVLPREGSEPMRVVFFNNQDRNSTAAIFDYVTWDPDTDQATYLGEFQWQEIQGSLQRKGKAMWGIPE